ncbi:ankyrin repeat domain-containing protein [Actinoplanes sp. NPDC026670]|uniref:ankyrin repeat domain-containing protein n=1 Tax=Actinoplanes sp. NPDC026670 TaxID=3154700 RepID=UPI003407E478
MPTLDMPERPDLGSFRRQARSLQRAAQSGDHTALARLARHLPGDLRLAAAQLVIAREYGFASWPRLKRYVATVAEHGWETRLGTTPAAGPADEFCRLACLSYSRDDGPGRWAQARQLLAERPELTRTHIWAAATAARPGDVARLLAERPGLAVERGGPHRWRPLFHLVYSRLDPTVPADDVLTVARQLLDAGADPNEGYLFDALPSPFTLITGVFGHGELGTRRQPSHPHQLALGRLLLSRGADPNDAQTLYNRMFDADDSHLELLFHHGLGAGSGGPWHTRIPELDPPARMLRLLSRWAIQHHQPARVRLLAEHGVDLRTPYEEGGPTPVELAHLNGDPGIAELLLSLGAAVPGPDPVRDLIAAAFRADRAAVEQIRDTRPEAVEQARRTRPGLMVWASTRAPAETATLLAELGFDVNAYGRGDAPIEEPWETALHHAAGAGNVELTRRLLELGADPTLRDKRFDATPLGWAVHLGHTETASLLEPVTP